LVTLATTTGSLLNSAVEDLNRKTKSGFIKPKIGSPKVVYRDPYQRIDHIVADFGEFSKEYFVRVSGRRAGILVLKNGAVLFTRQYRLQINDLSWEIPGGQVDDGESPEEAAIRECLEETGIKCTNLKPLLTYLPGLDIAYNPTHIFHTENHQQVSHPEPNPREVVERVWVPMDQCLAMILGQEIIDALSIIAIMAYQIQARQQ